MVSSVSAAGALREVRLRGAAGRVAMSDVDWRAFREDMPRAAHARLHAALRTFCRVGADHLAEQLFHAVAGVDGGRAEEFVARGARVVGRRATDGSVTTFFVTEVRWEPVAGAARPPRPAQHVLPLDAGGVRKGVEL